MDTNVRKYEIDNGNLSVCRHFGGDDTAKDIIRRYVLQQSQSPDFLTESSHDDIMSTSLREPHIIRRS